MNGSTPTIEIFLEVPTEAYNIDATQVGVGLLDSSCVTGSTAPAGISVIGTDGTFLSSPSPTNNNYRYFKIAMAVNASQLLGSSVLYCVRSDLKSAAGTSIAYVPTVLNITIDVTGTVSVSQVAVEGVTINPATAVNASASLVLNSCHCTALNACIGYGTASIVMGKELRVCVDLTGHTGFLFDTTNTLTTTSIKSYSLLQNNAPLRTVVTGGILQAGALTEIALQTNTLVIASVVTSDFYTAAPGAPADISATGVVQLKYGRRLLDIPFDSSNNRKLQSTTSGTEDSGQFFTSAVLEPIATSDEPTAANKMNVGAVVGGAVGAVAVVAIAAAFIIVPR